MTERDGDISGKPGGDVRGMLLAVGGRSDRTQSGIDLTRAAKSLGVSRRTAERWAAGSQKPSAKTAKGLARQARQAATTQAGRRAALASSGVRQQAKTAGVQIWITGLQGPPDPPLPKDPYKRSRVANLALSAADADAMFAAYEKGGDDGFINWARTEFGPMYEVDDWEFESIDNVRIGPARENPW